MTIKLKYFGLIAECCQQSEELLQLPAGSTAADLKLLLEQKYPILIRKSYQLYRNQQLAVDTVLLREADELALLPPFAGG